MQPTTNLQQQPSSSIQQPGSGIQDGDSSLSTQNFTQDQLVAPQLRVGNATVGQQSQTRVVPPAVTHHGISPLWLLIPIIVALAIFWPRTQTAVTEVSEPEPPARPSPASKKAPKKRPKSRPAKRRQTKR